MAGVEDRACPRPWHPPLTLATLNISSEEGDGVALLTVCLGRTVGSARWRAPSEEAQALSYDQYASLVGSARGLGVIAAHPHWVCKGRSQTS